jgi:hypothetical protein
MAVTEAPSLSDGRLGAGVQGTVLNPKRRNILSRQGSAKRTPTNSFERSSLSKASIEPPSPKKILSTKEKVFDDFTTLKRVCPSECQGAQGAFKDSMIH